MGHYSGVATRLKIKKTFDEGGLAFFKSIYDRTDDFPEELQKQVEPIISIIQGNSGQSYFPGWVWTFAKDCGEYWHLESRASTKVQAIAANFARLTQDMVEHLVLEKGDVVMRVAFEDHSVEDVVYFDGEKMVEGKGYVHSYEGMPPIVSCLHPSNTNQNYLADEETMAEQEAQSIPWSMPKIEELNKASYAEYMEELRRNSYGFGGL